MSNPNTNKPTHRIFAVTNLEAQIDGAYGDIDLTEARAAIAKAQGGVP